MDASLIYGVNPVLEALRAGLRVEVVYVADGLSAATRLAVDQQARARGVRVLKTTRKEMDFQTDQGVHQGVMAQVAKPAYASLQDLMDIKKSGRSLILCLDEVQDPRNLGALSRSALAFGVTGIVVPGHRSAQITPAAVKASSGALCRLPVARVTNLGQALDQLKRHGFWIAGTVGDSGKPPWSFDPGEKVALVLGSEGRGLRHGIEERLDFRVWIPMEGASESLNVSVAGAILFYEWLGRTKQTVNR